MSQVSQPTQKLINRYQTWYKAILPKEGRATIHVDEVASRVASFYERIRDVVEWKEEHLLRRAAIERSLKRRLFLQKSGDEIAEPFVLELIRGGNFPNDQIEEGKIEEIKKVLNKYLSVLHAAPEPPQEKGKVRLYDWLLDLAACEIEEILSPSFREKALIEYMTETMNQKIEMANGLDKKEKELQVFIACQRALFKMDSPIISYNLLLKEYPDWPDIKEMELHSVSLDIYSIWENMEKTLNHPLAEKFYKICERFDTPYLILGDILSENPSQVQEIFSQPETLESSVKKAYQKRLRKLKSRMARAAIFSTISIFLTKMLIAFAAEIPFDKYVLHEFNQQSLLFNVAIPPLLMFLMVLTIRVPKKQNLDLVIMEAMKIVYEKEKKDVYTIKSARKKGFILAAFMFILYCLTFVVSFYLIFWALRKLHFGMLSILIFMMFFSLISFAGVKIRERSRELDVMEKKTGFLTFLLDIFSLPFIRFGRFLSNQWSRYNIVIVIITALIDMPFHVFTEFLDHWRGFLKEKKEEIH